MNFHGENAELFIYNLRRLALSRFDHSVCVSAASHRSRKQWTEKAHKIYLLLYSHLFSRIPSASSRKNSRKTKGVCCVTTKLPIQWALFSLYSFQWPEPSLQHQFHIIFYGLEDFFIILALHCCLVNEYEICGKKLSVYSHFGGKSRSRKSFQFPFTLHPSSSTSQREKKTLNGNGVSVKLSSWPGC